MKKILIILILLTGTLASNSQCIISEIDMLQAKGWLLDSSFHSRNDIGYQFRYRVLERNESNFPMREDLSMFNFTTNEYNTVISWLYYYPVENDSNILFKTEISQNNTGSKDSIVNYSHNNDDGYKVDSKEKWSNGGEWIEAQKEKSNLNFTYPSHHYLRYKKSSELSDWILYDEGKASFNNDSSIFFAFYSVRIESGMDTTRKSFTYYNEHHLPYEKKEFTKNDGSWIISESIQTAYDENKQITQIIGSKYYDGEFSFNDKTIYEYDENGFLKSEQRYNWDRDQGIWKFVDRVDFVNDSLGNVLTKIEFSVITDTVWVAERKFESLYNESNKQIQVELFHSGTDNIWIPYSITFFTYQNLYSSYEILEWDTMLNEYRNKEKNDLIFDENGRLIEMKYYDVNPADYSWRLNNTYTFNIFETANQIIKRDINYSHISGDSTLKDIFYLNMKSTGVFEISPNSYSLFPNPSNEVIYIQSDIFNSQKLKYEIFNLNGQLVKIGSANSSGNINIQELISGLYFLKIYKPDTKIEILKFQKIE